MKRSIWFAIVLVVLGTMVAACAAPAPAPQAAEEPMPAEEATVAEETAQEAPAEEAATAMPEQPGFSGKLTIAAPAAAPKADGSPGNYEVILNTIAERYQEAHPDVEVEINYLPNKSFTDLYPWMDTHIAASTMPDIMVMFYKTTGAQEAEGSTPFIDISPYLNKENPYTGNLWDDEYPEGPKLRHQVWGVKGIYFWPPQLAAAGFLYNKDIFEKEGLEPPTTWDEFYDLLVTLKERGYDVPFTLDGSAFAVSHFWWRVHNAVADAKEQEVEKKYGVHGRGAPPWQYRIAAYCNGDFPWSDPVNEAVGKWFIDIASQFPPGWNALTGPQVQEMFFSGQSAIMYAFTDTIRDFDDAKEQGLIDFDMGVFLTPPITENQWWTAEMAANAADVVEDGGWGYPWSVSSPGVRANKEPIEDLAIDFMMFAGAPEQQKLFPDLLYAPPSNPYAASTVTDERILTMLEGQSKGGFATQMGGWAWYGPDRSSWMTNVVEPLAVGQITNIDEWTAAMDKYSTDWINQALAEKSKPWVDAAIELMGTDVCNPAQ